MIHPDCQQLGCLLLPCCADGECDIAEAEAELEHPEPITEGEERTVKT